MCDKYLEQLDLHPCVTPIHSELPPATGVKNFDPRFFLLTFDFAMTFDF